MLSKGDLEGALGLFHEIIMTKRKGNIEKIMVRSNQIRHVETCADLEDLTHLKEALLSFRNQVQNVSPQSLQVVLEKLRIRVEEKVQSCSNDDLSEIIDLEVEEAPETLLIASVSVENDKKAINSMRFLWEVYKLSLDLLKTNGRMVMAYKDSAISAISFCERYKRLSECRKLCETLRNHLINILRIQNSSSGSSLTYMMKLDEETLKNLIPIREKLMEVCMKLNLWQEAFRAAEDTRLLICEGKPAPATLARYWFSLSRIFWKAGQNLFHAYALYLYYYQNKKHNKKFTGDALLANVIVLATLAVPTFKLGRDITGVINETILSQEINAKLSTLLIQSAMVTREQLIELLNTNNILELASKEIRDLFILLENQFLPLTLSQLVKPLLATIREASDFQMYVPPIEQLLVGRVLAQLSTCYKSIRLETLYKLIDFIDAGTLEKYIIEVSIKTSLKIRIDQSNNAIFFEDPNENLEKPAQIARMAESLFQVAEKINSKKKIARKKEIVLKVFADIDGILDRSFEVRQSLTDDGKKINKERDDQLRKKMEEDKKQKELEKRKAEEDAKQRERTMKLTQSLNEIEREKKHITLVIIKSVIEKMRNFGFSSKDMSLQGKKIEKMNDDELLEAGPDEFIKLHSKLYEKSVKERQTQVKNQQKSLEYNERAKREYMNPLIIEKWAESSQVEIETKKTLMKEKFDKDLAMKKQFERIKSFKSKYIAEETQKAKVTFDEIFNAWYEKMKNHYKAEILAAARKSRENEKKKREEEEARVKDEAERKKRADEARSKEISSTSNIGWRKEQPRKPDEGPRKFVSNRTNETNPVSSTSGFQRNFEKPPVVEEKKAEGQPRSRFFNTKKKQEADSEGFKKVASNQGHS
jgi:translation initiation factor 3 subunit A